MKSFDLICVGDVIVDLFVQLEKGSDRYNVDKEKKELTFLLGEKILVDNSSFSIGGNATHVAIGLSRLGHSVGLGVEIGTDEFAEKILKDLDREHITKELLVQTPGSRSSFTVSISTEGERTILVSHIKRKHNIPIDNVDTKWIFLTSMGDEWEAMYRKTVEYARARGAKLAFNPGSTQLKKGAASFEQIIKSCDILFVNKEEAEEILYGEVLPHEKKESPESLLFRLNRMGPKMTVITDGANGSWALGEDATVYHQKPFSVEVTEKTGAGDGFTAGFLGALLGGKTIQEALLWGSADAAGVITKVGGQEGLLTQKELEDMIEKNL